MIPRYTPKAFAELWSDKTRYGIWLDVELAACQAMETEGLVPKGTAASIRAKNIALDPVKIDEIERTTRHDVIAFLTHVEQLAGEPARWLHRGMTSSDVLDTSFAIQLARAADLLLERTDALIAALATRAKEHARTPQIGRSHGISAEPVSFGIVLAGHLAEIKRGRLRLARARQEVAVGKIAGAVGTYAHLSPELEERALSSLGLSAETVSTQVVARDRHASFFAALALLAAGIERFATNVRHWQRSEVGEAEERFSAGQKGSSAMPHKRNPVLSENLCGLARVVRAGRHPSLGKCRALARARHLAFVRRTHAGAGRDHHARLHARTLYRAGRRFGRVREHMKRNLERSGSLFFSEAILLALIGKGLGRQEAYVLVQRNAMKAFQGEGQFRALLGADADVSARLSAAELDECFDLEHSLRFAERIVDRAIRA